MTRIKVSEMFLGMHHWWNAPDEVSFLRSDHVHDFKTTVSCSVDHNDRDLEFYIIRKDLRSILKSSFEVANGIYLLKGKSCEDVARIVLDSFAKMYGKGRDWKVTVAENPQQSATVYDDLGDEVVVDIDEGNYDIIISKARDIFVGRKSSYGNSVNEIDVHTIVGLMRMKLFRIYNEGLTPKAEDELLDTINYAVFALSRVSSDD